MCINCCHCCCAKISCWQSCGWLLNENLFWYSSTKCSVWFSSISALKYLRGIFPCFSSEVKVCQPLTALTSDFLQSLKQINPHGKTLLYDAINIAQQLICHLTKGANGGSLYSNSRPVLALIFDISNHIKNFLKNYSKISEKFI